MLAFAILVLMPWVAGGWTIPGNAGQAIAQWTLPPSIGKFACMDCAHDGLVVGTTKGFVVKFGVEQNLKPDVTWLAREKLLNAESREAFVGGTFYDRTMQKYVVRTMDKQGFRPPFQVCHDTHVLGSGFMRVHMDLCYFSLSIDGVFVVTSLRRGIILRKGKIQDFVDGDPSCVSIVEDGKVAVGTHDRRVVLVDICRKQVLSWTHESPFAPLAIHAVRKHGRGSKASYAVAWTGACGSVCTGSIVGRRNPVCLRVQEHGQVADESLVRIRISEQATSMTMQTLSGKTTFVRSFSTSVVEDTWMVPMPCMDNFVWSSNEKYKVDLLYFEDLDPTSDALPCDSAH